jgi:hypothetical protein
MKAGVAVLETNPDASPVIGSPKRGPRSRTAIYLAALIETKRITIFHMMRGLMAP